ncbi:TPA: hypothetical protein ACH3X2_011636 [Trebouxia sp. C0005]
MNRRDDKRSSLLEAVPTKGLVGRRALQWPGHQSGSQIAAHRAKSKHASSAHKKHHPGSPHPTPQIPKLPVSALDAKSSFKGRPGVAPDGQVHSPRSRKDVWDEDQSLLNILSQPSPHRPWSAGGFTGRPQLNTSVSDGQLLPGTVAWNSPRNRIGVHPESLLFNRDPEQLAEDVIGLSQKYASLANEHRLQKVQINKLSASLSRERAEAAELSDLAEIMGLPSPRSRAVSRPGSPGRALRSPYKSPSRPNTAKIRAEQSAVDANMPEWVFTDLQQRLNAAQQLLTQQSMAYEQGPLAGTWPRSRPRSPARRGGRRASAHISLDPNSRLADAFAIYGVPRGITQYMSRKWSSGSPRGASIPLESPIRQSSISGQQQLQEKLAAVRKASHVILLEAMQLRANFPPAVSPEEAEALGPHLDALVNLLHNHSRQVQDELAMLPGAVFSGPSPSGPSPSGPSPSRPTPTFSMARPANPSSSSPNPRAQHVLGESDVYLTGSSSFSDAEEKPAAADLDADAEAEADADADADDDVNESSQQYQAAAADADSDVTIGGEEEEATAEPEPAAGASPEMVVATEDSKDQFPETDHDHQSAFQQTHWDAVQSQEAVISPQKGSVDSAGDRLEAAPGGSGIMDEYLRRMHFSKETPLPSPPQGLPTRTSMPRRWSKTNSYRDGRQGAQESLESEAEQSPSTHPLETPVEVMTYDESASGHVAPVSAESAQAAFEEACATSMKRREDVSHPEMHVGKSDESSVSEPVSHLDHAASSASQQSEPLSQPRASRVTWDDEEVTTQLPSQSRQLSPSQSVLSQIAESAQDQAELVSADADTSVSLEADLPDLASEAEEAAESAEDDYGNEFEADEPLVDESPDSSPAEAPSETIYDNPLGSENSESASIMPDQDMSGHVAPTHGATLAAQVAPHETHVATQLAVSDQGSIKLHYGLEEEDQSLADIQQSVPTDPADAGHMEPHVITKVMASADDSVKLQCELATVPVGEEDAQAAGLLAGQGTSLHQPFTPMARASVFSASANLSDNVDIFSKTQPALPKAAAAAATAASSEEADSDLAPGYGQHLARVRSGLNKDSDFEPGRDLTPAYRRQEGRSLQQAVDNEQPFGTAWRNQMPMAPVSQHVCASVTEPDASVPEETGPASGTEAVSSGANPVLAPKPASQAPSRHSSLGSGSTLRHQDRQPSLSTAAALMPEAEQLEPSTAGTAGSLNASAKQPNLSKSVAGGTADTLSSQNSLAPQFSLSKLASGALSKQPSYLDLLPSGASSRRSSFSARLERETSQMLFPGQISNAGVAAEQSTAAVSRMASLGGGGSPLLSPEVSGGNLAAHASASEAAPGISSRQPSVGKPASLSHQASHVSRQASRQASIEAAAAAEAASAGSSRQPSFSRQASLSQQSSQMLPPSSSNQAAAKAASNVPSRKSSFSRPASASRQGSQLLQPQLSGSGENLLLSRSSSRLPFRQGSLSDSVQSASLSNASPVRQPSAVAHATAESNDEMSHSSQVQSHDQTVAGLKPVSRTQSVSSQPQRTSSLEVMHISRKAPPVERDATAVAAGSTAAAQAPAVLPGMATSDSPPKIEHTGANKTSVEDMRRPSVVSREVDSVLKALLPYGSGVPKVSHDNDVLEDALPISDTEQFEVHHVNEAAEKHAYLHSQHGMDDVF